MFLATSPQEEALQAIERYVAQFAEPAAVHALRTQLAQDAGGVFLRSNMRGHLTTSALALDEERQRVLLIRHGKYQRWLPPGGHYEPTEPASAHRSWLLASALRELGEETGLQGVGVDAAPGQLVPLDIDTHPIPADPRKGEGVHVHHDLLYLVRGDSSRALRPQLAEVSDCAWVPVANLASLGHARLLRLHAKLLQLGVARPPLERTDERITSRA